MVRSEVLALVTRAKPKDITCTCKHLPSNPARRENFFFKTMNGLKEIRPQKMKCNWINSPFPFFSAINCVVVFLISMQMVLSDHHEMNLFFEILLSFFKKVTWFKWFVLHKGFYTTHAAYKVHIQCISKSFIIPHQLPSFWCFTIHSSIGIFVIWTKLYFKNNSLPLKKKQN